MEKIVALTNDQINNLSNVAQRITYYASGAYKVFTEKMQKNMLNKNCDFGCNIDEDSLNASHKANVLEWEFLSQFCTYNRACSVSTFLKKLEDLKAGKGISPESLAKISKDLDMLIPIFRQLVKERKGYRAYFKLSGDHNNPAWAETVGSTWIKVPAPKEYRQLVSMKD